ncbi:MAG: YbaB/EbfC family nucleoid-associated protein [Gammaproteobacteria bacterium]|nr:MAG: YbaB/EbfC family nucleoid-associated protein [Gammaproteobacteria bacterium]
MKDGLGNIMKQAQAMQEKMQQVQEELAQTVVEGSAGGGLVSITMTCRHDVRKVSIDDDLLSEEKAVLEDLIAAAVNDAVRKVESTTQEKMSGMTAGMGLPSGMNLPF